MAFSKFTNSPRYPLNLLAFDRLRSLKPLLVHTYLLTLWSILRPRISALSTPSKRDPMTSIGRKFNSISIHQRATRCLPPATFHAGWAFEQLSSKFTL
jgi:hypothetical protein